MDESVIGTVKWFNEYQGYGFVIHPLGGGDILVHREVLQEYGSDRIPLPGEEMELIFMVTPDGRRRAAKVLSIKRPTIGEDAVVATVKWFNDVRGFGFVIVDGKRGDIFVHVEVFHKAFMTRPDKGDKILVTYERTKRGLMATAVQQLDILHALA